MTAPTNPQPLQTIEEVLAEFSIARDYPPLMYEESKNQAKAQLKQLIEWVIDTTKDVYYIKGDTPIETAEKFAETDRYCEIREELRQEQKARLEQLLKEDV